MSNLILQPMLAGKCEDPSKLTLPCIASVKLDGIRALRPGDEVLTRKFKPIPNRFLRDLLSRHLPVGIDGELMIVGEDGRPATFNACQSAVMREDGEPRCEFWAFDYASSALDEPYARRLKALVTFVSQLQSTNPEASFLKVVPYRIIQTHEELLEYEAWCVAEGYEGTMVRSPHGPYKCGRSTWREQYLLKIKRFDDFEAVVCDFVEQMHNANEATQDAFGRTKRSSHKANKTGKGTLGALVVKTPGSDDTFEVGTGFTAAQRQEIWDNKDKYLGRLAKIKSQPFGKKDRPRFPVWLGFRDERDTSP